MSGPTDERIASLWIDACYADRPDEALTPEDRPEMVQWYIAEGVVDRIREVMKSAGFDDLMAACSALLAEYVEGANSGDWGNFNPEEVPQVVAARAAIAKATGS
jgi:hypothetical protein